jgi:hypothetical protein
MGYSIEVDFDVYKAITARRANEAVTENDVMRELLGLPPAKPGKQITITLSDQPQGVHWSVKGVRFPAGTEFRAKYKGQTYTGRVDGGVLFVDGKTYQTPSAAAVAITGNPVNGWRFWECRLPGKTQWQLIEALRATATR